MQEKLPCGGDTLPISLIPSHSVSSSHAHLPVWEERCLSCPARQPGLEGRRLLGDKKLLPVTGGRVFVTCACALAQRCKYPSTCAVLTVKSGAFQLRLAARLYPTCCWNCEVSRAPGVSG